ncbi:MAG: T9SS type A sorting domain-containing protein, partial [Bacilli bacterium]
DKEINISSDKYPISLSVIDLFGREVLRKEIYNNRTIDLDFLKKDTYILKLKHKDAIINRKIIKK